MNNSLSILIMSYGTPEKSEDIEAYYTDILRGHAPNPILLNELQGRYAKIGGNTPLLTITEEQAKLLEQRTGIKTYVGMKHWHPYISEAVEQISKSDTKHIIALIMAPHYSVMSIGDYKARLEKAISEINPDIHIILIERWGDNPLFIDSLCQRIESTLKDFPVPSWNDTEVVFTAHSLPIKILETGDPYQKELMHTASLTAKKLRLPHWRQAFQSAGRTRDTWLGPDILTELQTMANEGIRQVMVAPIGFTTDNLEILYDLDVQASSLAQDLGITFKRIPCGNTTTRFIDALQNVIESVDSSTYS